MMKKMGLTAVFAALLLTGCGGNDELPSECVEMVELTKEIVEETGQELDAKAKEALDNVENEWANLNDEQKKETQKQCKTMVDMFNMLKSMKQQ